MRKIVVGCYVDSKYLTNVLNIHMFKNNLAKFYINFECTFVMGTVVKLF